MGRPESPAGCTLPAPVAHDPRGQPAIRRELASLRELANTSANAALSRHSRVRLWRNIVVEGPVIVLAFGLAKGLEVYGKPAFDAPVKALMAIGVITSLHLLALVGAWGAQRVCRSRRARG